LERSWPGWGIQLDFIGLNPINVVDVFGLLMVVPGGNYHCLDGEVSGVVLAKSIHACQDIRQMDARDRAIHPLKHLVRWSVEFGTHDVSLRKILLNLWVKEQAAVRENHGFAMGECFDFLDHVTQIQREGRFPVPTKGDDIHIPRRKWLQILHELIRRDKHPAMVCAAF
jgi:hypothetical protein